MSQFFQELRLKIDCGGGEVVPPGRGWGLPAPPTFLVCLSILFPFTFPAIGHLLGPSYPYPYRQFCLSFFY